MIQGCDHDPGSVLVHGAVTWALYGLLGPEMKLQVSHDWNGDR